MAEGYCWAMTHVAGGHAATDQVTLCSSSDFSWTSLCVRAYA